MFDKKARFLGGPELVSFLMTQMLISNRELKATEPQLKLIKRLANLFLFFDKQKKILTKKKERFLTNKKINKFFGQKMICDKKNDFDKKKIFNNKKFF